jgi:hypothetical protein
MEGWKDRGKGYEKRLGSRRYKHYLVVCPLCTYVGFHSSDCPLRQVAAAVGSSDVEPVHVAEDGAA